MVDLLIKNGRIIDPACSKDEIGTIAIAGNQIVAADETNDALHVIDAEGCLVVPGLIDVHGHYFKNGSSHGVVPDMQVAHGVTTVNDAGSAGAANFEAYYQSVVAHSTIRMYTSLHLYTLGQPGFGLYEDLNPSLYSRKSIDRLLRKYADQIRSIKIRIDESVVSSEAVEYLKAAVAYCEELHLPLIVHASNLPCSPEDIARELRPNDVFCHCFQGKKNPIIDENGVIYPEIWAARSRGVLFDCSNGYSNFNCKVGKAAMEQGFHPDFISTDVTPLSNNRNGFAKNLPYLMSKYLELGMSLYDVIRAVTEMPAKWLRLDNIGTLRAGSFADVTILKLENTSTSHLDIQGNCLEVHQLLRPQMTILDGEIVYSQIDF